MIFKKLYKNYWEIGFKTYLYDLFTPSAYFVSLQMAVESIDLNPKDIVLDVGCGTGQALEFLSPDIQKGIIYIGLDLLIEGVVKAKSKANSLGIRNHSVFIQADFLKGFPIKIASVDCLICHFVMYSIYDTDLRNNLMTILFDILKSGGTIVIVNPSKSYDPESIIHESVHLDKYLKNIFYRSIRNFIINPLAKSLGLKYVLSQLKNKQWRWFSLEELIDEISQVGFEVLSTKDVYGQSGYLVVARKP